jgi:hypothetical protein
MPFGLPGGPRRVCELGAGLRDERCDVVEPCPRQFRVGGCGDGSGHAVQSSQARPHAWIVPRRTLSCEIAPSSPTCWTEMSRYL